MNELFPNFAAWGEILRQRDQGLLLIAAVCGCAWVWVFALRPYPRAQRFLLNFLIVFFYYTLGVMIAISIARA